MRTVLCLSMAVLFSAAPAALADLVIDVPTYYLPPDRAALDAANTIEISVTSDGTDEVSWMQLAAQIGDGGSENSGTDLLPVIDAVNLVDPGMLFSVDNDGQTSHLPLQRLMQIADVTTSTPAAGADPVIGITGTAVIADLTIDTTGTAPDDLFPLLLKQVGSNLGVGPPGGMNTHFGRTNVGELVTSINDGWLRITYPGDANLDGQVGFSDFQALLDNWGTATGGSWFKADFSGDGAVGFPDFQALLDNWGEIAGPGPSAPSAAVFGVPEPSSVVLAVLGLLGILLLLRRRFVRSD